MAFWGVRFLVRRNLVIACNLQEGSSLQVRPPPMRQIRWLARNIPLKTMPKLPSRGGFAVPDIVPQRRGATRRWPLGANRLVIGALFRRRQLRRLRRLRGGGFGRGLLLAL